MYLAKTRSIRISDSKGIVMTERYQKRVIGREIQRNLKQIIMNTSTSMAERAHYTETKTKAVLRRDLTEESR